MGYLAAAFILVWAIIAVYVVYMGMRQRQQEQELTTLREIASELKAREEHQS